MENIGILTLGMLAVLAAFIGLAILFAIPVWLLWNAVIPAIFGLTQITLLQALYLNMLCGFLFKSYSSSSNSKN